MTEEWRTLLYPLGFLSALAFGSRFILQWIQSERQRKSVVTHLFWKLSLFGNISLALHAYIQVQYHVCLLQACNAIISWRNLNLMQKKNRLHSSSLVFLFLVIVTLIVTLLFLFQGQFLGNEAHWFRIPKQPWYEESATFPFWWHTVGFVGYFLFSSRFWIQWWIAEKNQISYLPPAFWWMSLSGAILSASYFILIHDIINAVGPLIGLIPYLRNLMLIQKSKIS